MSKKKIISIGGIVMAIALAAFLFVMPSSQSKPHEKRKMVVHADTPLRAVSVENPHLQQLLSEYEDAIAELMKNSQTCCRRHGRLCE